MKNPNFFEPFLLTPLDHAAPKIYLSLFLCFRLADPQDCLSELQTGIDKLILSLPFLSGEIVQCADSNGKSGLMRLQMPSASVRNITMLAIKTCPGQILPPNQCRSPVSSDNKGEVASLDDSYCPLPVVLSPLEPRPVLRFQGNILDDGLLLSISFNHSFFDATGAGKVIEMLADCCRVSSTETIVLQTDSKIQSELRETFCGLLPEQQKHIDHSLRYGRMKSTILGDSWGASAALSTSPFVFSSERIIRLRDACNSVLPLLAQDDTITENPQFLSSNDVLTALLGLSIQYARKSECGLAMAVNLRDRLQPSILAEYLGNTATVIEAPLYHLPGDMESAASLCRDHEMDREQLLRTAHIAFQLRKTLQSTDDHYIRSLISYLNSQNDWGGIDLQLADTAVSSWRHLSVYSLDFGSVLGKVENFEMQLGLADGAVVIFPANTNVCPDSRKTPWDVRVSLNVEATEALKKVALFRWALNGDI